MSFILSQLPKTAMLAPMAGVTDRAFREICVRLGACFVVGEMASTKGLVYGSEKTKELLSISPAERPMAIQLFGDDPVFMAKAVAIAETYSPSAIDINMGCPAPKITGNNSGSALLKNPRLAEEIVRAAVGATSLPITIKIRSGWDQESINAVEIAQRAENAGASAVIVHGRTRAQMYAPPVDYEIIRKVKEAVSIPVIGNGGVVDIPAATTLYQTGCDLIMVGRGALGNPWLFQELEAWFLRGERLSPPTPEEKMKLLLEHISLSCQYKGEYIALREARTHAAWYLSGLYGAARLRKQAGQITTYDDLKKLCDNTLEAQLREEN